jgi:hypothetical protein
MVTGPNPTWVQIILLLAIVNILYTAGVVIVIINRSGSDNQSSHIVVVSAIAVAVAETEYSCVWMRDLLLPSLYRGYAENNITPVQAG